MLACLWWILGDQHTGNRRRLAMQPPRIAPGKRFVSPLPPGSADALLLARMAEAGKAEGRVTAILTADPADAQRLSDELLFFAPQLRVALFPD